MSFDPKWKGCETSRWITCAWVNKWLDRIWKQWGLHVCIFKLWGFSVYYREQLAGNARVVLNYTIVSNSIFVLCNIFESFHELLLTLLMPTMPCNSFDSKGQVTCRTLLVPSSETSERFGDDLSYAQLTLLQEMVQSWFSINSTSLYREQLVEWWRFSCSTENVNVNCTKYPRTII